MDGLWKGPLVVVLLILAFSLPWVVADLNKLADAVDRIADSACSCR